MDFKAADFKPRLKTDASPEQLLKDLVLSPLIYMRVAGIVFSIIVFGCVADQVILRPDRSPTQCLYNLNNDACNFAVAVGVIAFLICLVFLAKDFVMVILDFSQAMKLKMIIIGVDIATSALWAFMWFVNFCFTADQRRKTSSNPSIIGLSTSSRNCANAGIAFSFFSIILWGAIIGVNIFFLFRIMKGVDRDSTGGTPAGGYASFPEGQDSSEGGGDKGAPYTPPEY